jgi:hypothetical protein
VSTDADLLRTASAKIRDDAETARFAEVGARSTLRRHAELPDSDFPDGEFVRSWSPAVALAVADWLRAVAFEVDNTCMYGASNEAHAARLVARTYLGMATP